MKIAGWIFIVIAILNFIVFILAVSSGASEAAGSKLGSVILFGVLGAFFLFRGKQKEQEKKDKDAWNQGE